MYMKGEEFHEFRNKKERYSDENWHLCFLRRPETLNESARNASNSRLIL